MMMEIMLLDCCVGGSVLFRGTIDNFLHPSSSLPVALVESRVLLHFLPISILLSVRSFALPYTRLQSLLARSKSPNIASYGESG